MDIFTEALEGRVLLSAGPTAKLSVQPVISAGNTIQSFVITYTDPHGISGSSISRSNIAVTAPNGQPLVISYETLNQVVNDDATVTYSVNAPGGDFVPASVFANAGGNYTPYSAGSGSAAPFTSADNGVYTVSINANSVYASNNAPAAAGAIGTFTVNVPSQTVPEVQFQQTTIDANPGGLPVSKALIDIYDNGNLEPIVGHNDGTGLYWYAPQTPGDVTGTWVKHTIAANGYYYEDLQVADVNGDGYPDIVASLGNGNGDTDDGDGDSDVTYEMIWLENPQGTGGDPTQPWQQFDIGPGLGHNFSLADVDRDGKLDVITQRAIYFQNSPTSWDEVDAPQLNMGDYNGEETFDALGNGDVDVIGISNDANHPMAWFENPLNTGGNPRTDTWQQHIIGPGYINSGNSISFNAADFNGDGRTDIVTAVSERDNDAPFAPAGGLIVWLAPADPTQLWTPITLDSSYTDVHKIDVADMNGDGYPDVVIAEQEQSVNQRISIFYNVGGTAKAWQQQVLTNTASQNIRVGDLNDDGLLDIFGANHGVFNAPHPVEAWIQTGSVNATAPAAPTDLRAYQYSDSQVTLSWQDSTGLVNDYLNAIGFVVERSTDQINFAPIARLGVGTSTYLDSDVTPGTTYYYRVAATNGASQSADSGIAGSDGSTTIPAPTPPATSGQIGTITSKGKKAGKLSFTTTAGTAVTLKIAAGSATASQESDGSIDLDVQATGNAKITVATRGGDGSVIFGNVQITGTVAQFTAKAATLAGLFSATGAIKNLRVAQITGIVAAGSAIGTINAGTLADGSILAGATFSGGTSLADAAFGPGSIAAVKITGAISDFTIAAGAGPASSGAYAATGDQNFGGTVGAITSKGGADFNSLFIADVFKHANLPKRVTIASDPRFIIL